MFLSRAPVALLHVADARDPTDAPGADGFATFLGRTPVVLRGPVARWRAPLLWRDRGTLAARLGGADSVVTSEVSADGHFDPARPARATVELTVAETIEAVFAPLQTRGQVVDYGEEEGVERGLPQHLYCKLPLTHAMLDDLGSLPCAMTNGLAQSIGESGLW
ncbi:hypothetical protein T492DRAFT_853280 [Pavlovales sp. CCMP2436]|nr:hypothetical protein T492DRAFT_853280 [Pavlovales sp. CCMP2436]